MINNTNFNFLNIKSFTLFECENFFSDELYQDLLVNFPLVSEKKVSTKILKNQKNNKFVINNEMPIYEELIQQNIAMKKLNDIIFSQNFIDSMYKRLFFKFIISKYKNINDLFKLLKKPKLYEHMVNLNKLIYQQIKVTIEYSYILNSGKIVPHTDNPTKLLSLMVYFPDYQNKNNKLYEKEEKLGTIFWKSKKKNFSNTHQFDDLEKKFIDDKSNKKIFQTKFKKNHLYGFIKNENSWHSVDKIDMYDGYIRKSININLHF